MPAEGEPGHAATPPGGPASRGGPTPQRAPYALPAWLFPLGLVTALEPPVLIVAYFVNSDLAGGHLLAYAFAGGLFVSLPSLGIVTLSVLWHRRLTMAADAIPGVPDSLTHPTVSRTSAVALAASTLVFGLLLAVLLGGWGLLAVPPLALSLASAWLMNGAADARG